MSLSGSVVKADKSGDEALYASTVDRRDILSGTVHDMASAHVLENELRREAD